MATYGPPSRYGRRVASLAGLFFVFDVLVSLIIHLTFLGKFRQISDIFGLSLELKKVGASFVLALGECAQLDLRVLI